MRGSLEGEPAPFVREALSGDADRVVQLAFQLGYEVPRSHAERVLATQDEHFAVFVAVIARAGVVGWISVARRDSITTSGAALVEGLVVADEYRGAGIGKHLLERAESWARTRRCLALCVRSNVIRERAHGFYLREGFAAIKDQRLFMKRL